MTVRTPKAAIDKRRRVGHRRTRQTQHGGLQDDFEKWHQPVADAMS
jgi:hypothetical protein